MEFDGERIIMEVEKYPVLYNPMDDNYKNRNAKIEAWKKVTEAVVGELYQTLDEKQQNDIGKEVQKRWKTMKDTYLRSLKTQVWKTGSGASKRRPYVYHLQMSFLRPTIENRRTTGSGEGNTHAERNDDDDEHVSEEGPSPAVIPRVPCAKKKKEGFETQLINLLKEKQASSNEMSLPPLDNDADKMFLLSLLPKIKTLNECASFDFQIKVMQLLQGYLSDCNNLRNQPSTTRQPSNFCGLLNLPSSARNVNQSIPPEQERTSLTPLLVQTSSSSQSASQSVVSPVNDVALSPTDDTTLNSVDSVLSFCQW